MQRRYKMNIRPIRNERDYDSALDRVDVLMDLDPDMGTKESDELEILVMFIEKIIKKHKTIYSVNYSLTFYCSIVYFCYI